MLLEKVSTCDIILGSQSPRRQFLLKELGLDFSVWSNTDIDETYPQDMNRMEIPVYLAKKKAGIYQFDLKKNDVLITADTIVYCSGKVINKPVDYNDAVNILKKLSGKKHEVITGVCISSQNRQTSFYSMTYVYFRDLNDEEIKYYIDTCQPFDKAGAYGIQEWIGYIAIEKIQGSFYNVMGLPVEKLYIELEKFLNINEK